MLSSHLLVEATAGGLVVRAAARTVFVCRGFVLRHVGREPPRATTGATGGKHTFAALMTMYARSILIQLHSEWEMERAHMKRTALRGVAATIGVAAMLAATSPAAMAIHEICTTSGHGFRKSDDHQRVWHALGLRVQPVQPGVAVRYGRLFLRAARVRQHAPERQDDADAGHQVGVEQRQQDPLVHYPPGRQVERWHADDGG